MVASSSCNEAKFKKIQFTKLYRFGLVPTSNFTMKISSDYAANGLVWRDEGPTAASPPLSGEARSPIEISIGTFNE